MKRREMLALAFVIVGIIAVDVVVLGIVVYRTLTERWKELY